MAEAAIGGSGDIDFQLLIDTKDDLQYSFEQRNTLSPQVSIWADFFEFTMLGAVAFDSLSAEIDLSVHKFKLDLFFIDIATMRLGVFNYLPGTSEFVSNTNFFSRTDYEKLLTGSTDDSLKPATLVQAGFFWLDFYLLVTVNPLRPDMILPDPESAWFPMHDVPESVTIQLFADEQTIVLDNIYYVDEALPTYDLMQISISPELGATFFGIDVSLLYYYGFDNTQLVGANFKPYGLYDSDPYDIELLPVYRKIHAIGLNMATYISALRFWGDAAFTFNKSFLTNRVSFSNRNTPVVEHPFLEYSLGLSYEFSVFDLVLFGEVKHSHVFSTSDAFVDPLLRSIAVAALRLSLFDYALTADVSAIISLLDGSLVSVLKLAISPIDELPIEVLSPLFFGDADTELGQYSSKHLISSKIIWRF